MSTMDPWMAALHRLTDALAEALTSTDPVLLAWPPTVANTTDLATAAATLASEVGDALAPDDPDQQPDLVDALTKLLTFFVDETSTMRTMLRAPVNAEDAGELAAVWAFRTAQLLQPHVAAALAGIHVFEYNTGDSRFRWRLEPSLLRDLIGFLEKPQRLLALLTTAAAVPLDSNWAALPAVPGDASWKSFYAADTKDWFSLTLRTTYLTNTYQREAKGQTPDDSGLLNVTRTPITGENGVAKDGVVTLAVHAADFPEIWLRVSTTAGATLSLKNGWSLETNVNGAGSLGIRNRQGVKDWDVAVAGALTSAFLDVVKPRPDAAADPALVLGKKQTFFLEVARIAMGLRLTTTDSDQRIVGGSVTLQGVHAGVGANWLADLGVTSVEKMEFTFDLAVSADTDRGLRVRGSGSGVVRVEVEYSLDLGFFTLTLHTLEVGVRVEKGAAVALRLDATLAIKTYVTAHVVGVGAWVGWSQGASYGFIGPDGLHLAVTIDPVVGGGGFERFDTPYGRGYAGTLELKIKGIGIAAVGRYEKTPSGAVSVVAVLGIRFDPGITLPYGIMIVGLGGMIGINRAMDLDQLRARVCDGSAGDTLFCDNPVKNAGTILPALQAMFPVRDDSYLAGPTVRLTWAKGVVQADLGVFFQFPQLAVAVLGRVRVPGVGNPLEEFFALRLDVLGSWSMAEKLIAVDAALVDSTVLRMFVVTGAAAIRLSYGSPPFLLISVGGFHPGFDPAPCPVGPLARVGASLSVDRGFSIRVALESYVALTSSTLQFGAAVALQVEAGSFTIKGAAGFDVLIRFDPLSFRADLYAQVSIKWRKWELADAQFHGALFQENPAAPLTVQGKASIRVPILGTKTWEDSATLGEPTAAPPAVAAATAADVLTVVEDELLGAANWAATLTDDPLVQLAGDRTPVDPDAVLTVLPVGALRWSQRRLPLDTTMSRLDGALLVTPAKTTLTPTTLVLGAPIADDFARGLFEDLDDSQAMSGPAFTSCPSGFHLSAQVADLRGADSKIRIGSGPFPADEVPFLGYADSVVAPTPTFTAQDTASPPMPGPTAPPTASPVVTVRPGEDWVVLDPAGRARPAPPPTEPSVDQKPVLQPPACYHQAEALTLATLTGGYALPAAEVLAAEVLRPFTHQQGPR